MFNILSQITLKEQHCLLPSLVDDFTCVHSKYALLTHILSTLFCSTSVLFSCTPFGTKSYTVTYNDTYTLTHTHDTVMYTQWVTHTHTHTYTCIHSELSNKHTHLHMYVYSELRCIHSELSHTHTYTYTVSSVTHTHTHTHIIHNELKDTYTHTHLHIHVYTLSWVTHTYIQRKQPAC